MSQQAIAEAEQIVLRRTLTAPVERVYRAWTDPAQMARWFLPNARWESAVVDLDPRVGGHQNITMRHSDGDEIRTVGRYLEVVPNERLRFTWAWPESPYGPEETCVTVEFRAVPGGTELTLTHDRQSDPRAQENTASGWAGCLDTLQSYLSA